MLKDGVLQVRMLGEFSVTWDGKEICGGSKSADTQFVRLLQLLLHYREEGIERTRLQSLLFDDSNSEDVHHLLRTVIYNTRKRLAKAGLPDVKLIEFSEGRYFWTKEIPVEIDTEAFESLCALAAEETDQTERLKKYRAAIAEYKGSFLPNQTRLSWAAAEESRYRVLFTECVEEVAKLLREQNDYEGIEMLGREASAVCPLNDWEHLVLEAYVHTGRMREAQDLYEKTSDYYQKKLGAMPAFEKTGRLDRLLELLDWQYTDMDAVANDLQEEAAQDGGGYFCTYPVFRGIYHMMNRSIKSVVLAPYLMLCTVNRYRFRTANDVEVFEKNVEGAKRAICAAADSRIVICRCSREQFLILIPDGSKSICKGLEKRINRIFGKDSRGDVVLSFKTMPLKQ